MIDGLVDGLVSTPGWIVLLLVFLGPALEASIFLGVIVPGEIMVIIGGVVASQHRLSLTAVLVAAIAGAVGGDQIGFYVGARWGERVLRKIPDRILDEARLAKAQSVIRRLGVFAVIGGRWTASLRALVPGLCGMSGMHYRRFAIANALGGSAWAATITLLGYAAGSEYKTLEHELSTGSLIAVGVVVVLVVAYLLVRKARRARSEREQAADRPSA